MRGAPPRLGLRENLAQFSLLVLVNAFVGAMVGMERSILPAIAEQEFDLAARPPVQLGISRGRAVIVEDVDFHVGEL